MYKGLKFKDLSGIDIIEGLINEKKWILN